MLSARSKNPPRCKVCKRQFEKFRPTQIVCGPECSIKHTQALKDKKGRVEAKQVRAIDKKRREALKSRSAWLKDAQVAFNAFIRVRDADEPCISCGRYHDGAFDAGHYRSVGAMPGLRFNELNCHKQCVPCNQHKAGNIVEYRLRLIKKIGIEAVDSLEKDWPPAKLTIDDIKGIRDEYRAKLKELES